MFRLVVNKPRRITIIRSFADAKKPSDPKCNQNKDSKKPSSPPKKTKSICNVLYPYDAKSAEKMDTEPFSPHPPPKYIVPSPDPCAPKDAKKKSDKDKKSEKEDGDAKETTPPPPPKKTVDPRRVFKIYRFGGIQTGEIPSVDSFELDVSTCGKMVLDALLKLKEMDPSLTFRKSCREGICGSCGICLQGHNCLACVTKLPDDKTISIYPLPHMYVIRDLVVDMSHFFNAYDSIRPYLIRKNVLKDAKQEYYQSVPDSLKMVGLYECVLCGCCSTSCPSYWWNGRRFLGPCALLHAYRWIIDSRDDGHNKRLFALRDDFQAFRCHTILNCNLACPKDLNPGRAIALLKRMIVGLDKKPRPEIDPMKLPSGAGLQSCLPQPKSKEKQEPTPKSPCKKDEPAPKNPCKKEEPAPKNPCKKEEPTPKNPCKKEEPAPKNPCKKEEPTPKNKSKKQKPIPKHWCKKKEPAPKNPCKKEDPTPKNKGKK